MTTADIDMEALISWGLDQSPPACPDGVARARQGWAHLNKEDRYWCAWHGGMHSILAYDPDSGVRTITAEKCGEELLELLSRDSHWAVRTEVARRCGAELLETLVQDSDPAVRIAVARRGCPAVREILSKDPHPWVRLAATERLKEAQ